MKIITSKLAEISVFTILISLLSSCTLFYLDQQEEATKKVIFNFKSYVNGYGNDATVPEVDMYMFNNGILKSITHHTVSDNIITFELADDAKAGTKLFFLADTDKAVDYSHLVEGKSLESDFLIHQIDELSDEANEVPTEFYAGILDCDATEVKSTTAVAMERGVARLDINIPKELNLSIESMDLSNILMNSYVFKQPEGAIIPQFKAADFHKRFSTPLTTTASAVYNLLEQTTSNSQLVLNAKLSGKETSITVDMPLKISRNNIYDINITESGGGIEATLVIREWEDGGGIDVDPDHKFNKIDLDNSELPSYVRVAKTLDTIFIPSCIETFKVAIASDAEIDIQVDGDIVVTPSLSADSYINTSYNITSSLRAETKIAYMNIKNKNLTDYYGNKIVLVLEKSEINYTGKLLEYFQPDGNISFNSYIDGDLGTIEVPEDTIFEDIEAGDWLRFEDIASEKSTLSLLRAGFRPNDMENNGTVQEYSFKVTHKTGVVENIKISRISYSLPVVKMRDNYWCMYNLRGNTRKFEDQILEVKDDLYNFLGTCSSDDLIKYAGDGYKGTDLNGLKFGLLEFPSDIPGEPAVRKFAYENYEASDSPGAPGTIKTCPDGYNVPSLEEIHTILNDFKMPDNNIFAWNATGGRQHFIAQTRNLIHRDSVYGNVNIYSSSDVVSTPKLVLYGLGFQNSPDLLNKAESYMAYDKGLWRLYNSNSEVRAGSYTGYVTQYIRCIKTPGFFLY